MKPDWDKLIAEYKDSKTTLIADVDCTTAGGKSLCDQIGIKGFPGLKHGDPADLQDYEGNRDLDSLKEFAAANLGPICGIEKLDNCDEEQKATIAKLSAMSPEDLDKQIAEKMSAIETLEGVFTVFGKGLDKMEADVGKKKDEGIKAIKASGLGLMKSVAAHKAQKEGEL